MRIIRFLLVVFFLVSSISQLISFELTIVNLDGPVQSVTEYMVSYEKKFGELVENKTIISESHYNDFGDRKSVV